ncbi:immunoglobulin-like domain-containing protein [Thermococcus pacificus]|uniref:Bacterial Ig-like domain-containing protein n=1 Tax=Thermococcus pacificus TaxID=71998 RepID=A0A218P8Z4_9EURY|nr:immunoglobulin-like domain-containing protein [Thermococcus pacificus]ASJ07254.1 hypothetical protein A3L08_07935 [Thermococcus pacificus]
MRWKTSAAIVVLILLIWGLTGSHFYMGLDKESYHPGEEPVLTLRNTGILPIYFGQPYTLYRRENGTWVRVRQGFFFNSLLYDLLPFGSWKQEIALKYLPENESAGTVPTLYNLPPGEYRLVKEICGWPRGCVNGSVEFEILP